MGPTGNTTTSVQQSPFSTNSNMGNVGGPNLSSIFKNGGKSKLMLSPKQVNMKLNMDLNLEDKWEHLKYAKVLGNHINYDRNIIIQSGLK